MQASTMAWVISSIVSLLMPSSRARLAAARAAAISMSSTIGRVSSICRSAVEVIASFCVETRRSKGEEHGNRGLDPLRNAAEALERQEREGVDAQKHGQCGGELDGLAADIGD